MSVRDELLAVIAAAVAGEGVQVIPFQDNLDLPAQITIMFKQLTLLPLEQAPRRAYRVNYVLTVISPATDPTVAEAELDVFIPSLLGDLDELDWFAWSSADKVLFQSNIAYDITCWNIARKEQ